MRRRYKAFLLLLVLPALLLQFVRVATGEVTASSWTAPTAMALKLVGPASDSLSQAAFATNLTCTTLTYRRTNESTMRSGCFVPTAYGLFDTDSSDVIFNGSDEGVPLKPYIQSETFMPWPNAADLLVLDGAATGGSYVSFYRDPLSAVQNVHDLAGRLTAKQFTAPHDPAIKDPEGSRLIINPQTIAYSSTGYWMVAETLSGSFVRINLATLDMVRFAPSFFRLGFPGLMESQVAVSDNGRYVALQNNDAATLKVYDLSSCIQTDSRPFQTCASFDYEPFVKTKVTSFGGISRLRFINDDTLSLTARSGNTTLAYLLAPRSQITHLLDYLALGDSYTSGEGAFDYLLGTDTSGNGCHLSRNSYPLLLANRVFSIESGRSVACSGAVINDLGSVSRSYRGQVTGSPTYGELENDSTKLNGILSDFTPGRLAQHYFARKYQPRVITVSVGGNDIGFGDILETCVAPHIGNFNANTCFNTYEDRQEVMNLIEKTGMRLSRLYEELRQDAPDSTIYALGYPQIADDQGKCALNVHLNQTELAFASELIDTIDQRVAQAAREAGVTYVDISQALTGHRLCETSAGVAVNGVTAGRDGAVLGIPVFGKESFHPNALGHALIADAILRQTKNFTDEVLSSPVAGKDTAFLTGPHNGRPVKNRAPGSDVISGSSAHSVHVQLRGDEYGLVPGATYSLIWGTPEAVPVQTVTTSVDNIYEGTIPATGAGPTAVHIIGPAQDGQTVDVTTVVYIPVSASDADGDSQPDTTDSCPLVANSGQDQDHDDIDDACDPATSTSAGNSGSESGGTPPSAGDSTNDTPASSTVPPVSSATSDPTNDLLQGNTTLLQLSASLSEAPEPANHNPATVIEAVPQSTPLLVRQAVTSSKPLSTNDHSLFSRLKTPSTGLQATVHNQPYRLSLARWWWVWLLAILTFCVLLKQKDRLKRRSA